MIKLDLTPPRPSRQVKKSFLVLCKDDEQSAYLEWLKSAFGHPLLTIRKLPPNLSPDEIVRFAQNLRRAEKIKGTHFDEVWCLVTVATSEMLPEVLELEKPGGVHLAVSVGEFKSWLELHWSGDGAIPRVLVEEASPTGFAAALGGRTNNAIEGARSEPGSTTVDRLVKALESSARAFRRRS